ncbi:metallophosphoesterase, partial [Paenibacillus sp. TAF58]
DETVHVKERLYIVGRKDKAAERTPDGREALAALLEGTDSKQPIIVMDHQPYHLDKAADAGADVMLSGHTHRGQMAPNHLITRRLFELDWGYLRKGNLHAIVSSGFGTWGPPIRLGSRSEIIELTIHFKSNKREEG